MYSTDKPTILHFEKQEVKKLVSVVIPTYNRRDTLKRAIDSVLSQTYQNIEIIVIDDGSTDDTSQLLASYGDKIFAIHQKNQGVSHARNTGIAISSGEWIAFLDSDDMWLESKIQLQLESLGDSKLLVNHTQEIWIRNGVRVNPKKKHFKYDGSEFNDNLDICRISPSSVVIHRSVFSKTGGFDISLPACEDYDLWLRICNQFEVQYLDKQLVQKTGGHEDQLSRKYFGMDRFRILSLAKMLFFEPLSEDRAQRIFKELSKKINIYNKGCLKREKYKEIEYFNNLQSKCMQCL
ncbi:MAG: glycosyltransferase [Candidatus Cloacimonetes bacterium]|nr:glycosyltransferase [Candidatus Cloacimonadota bacterium]